MKKRSHNSGEHWLTFVTPFHYALAHRASAETVELLLKAAKDDIVKDHADTKPAGLALTTGCLAD